MSTGSGAGSGAGPRGNLACPRGTKKKKDSKAPPKRKGKWGPRPEDDRTGYSPAENCTITQDRFLFLPRRKPFYISPEKTVVKFSLPSSVQLYARLHLDFIMPDRRQCAKILCPALLRAEPRFSALISANRNIVAGLPSPFRGSISTWSKMAQNRSKKPQ